jgi:hypothetical protein
MGQLSEITRIKRKIPLVSTLRLPLASGRSMLRVDSEPFESPFDRLTVLSNVEGLTAPRKIEGRSLRAVEGSRGGKSLDHFL